MSDSKDLEVLVKALERAAATSSAREPWQEHFDRTASVNQSDVLNTDIIQGFSGGWASSYNYGDGAIDNDVEVHGTNPGVPSPIRAKTHKLGQPGMSDVDFVPYNWNTNRYGSKGPSLIGSPISYEVVGPTAKSPFTDWTWKVTFEGGPNGGDLLEMDVRPDGATAVTSDVTAAYRVSLFDVLLPDNEPNGGLYMIVSVDGAAAGSIPSETLPFVPIAPHIETARYQIFRILAIYAIDAIPGAFRGSIELHPSKKLSTYFHIEEQVEPEDPGHLRAITLIQPYATRLIAIPGSGEGTGKEQTHVFVAPEQASKPDNYPPFITWDTGGFDPTGLPGKSSAYNGNFNLPIPRPQRQLKGTLLRASFLPGNLELGEFDIVNIENGNGVDNFQIAHIYHVELLDTIVNIDIRPILGWYWIRAVETNTEYKLNRMVEVDPESGKPFFGPVFLQAGSGDIVVYFTVHEPITALWNTSIFDIDKVQAARLRHLIDPRKVERADKQLSFDRFAAANIAKSQPRGATPARGDRAIFNTKTFDNGGAYQDAEDPGSLQDLGFRVVLFPAKAGSFGAIIPDFDRPIRSREVLLDPEVTESQYIDIDYSGGVVRLSHAPAIGTGDISPSGIIETSNNLRKESILFAACVPFSQEPSQRGGGPRITCKNPIEADVFSDQVIVEMDETNSTTTPNAPFFVDIALSEDMTDRIPETGMFNLVGTQGTTGDFGIWSYSSTRLQNFGGGNVTVLEEITSNPEATDPTPAATLVDVIFRREVTFGIRSADFQKETDTVWQDRAYGSALRASTVRFEDSTCKYELDGSVTVTTSASGTNITIEDDGVFVLSDMVALNFIGAGVVASDAGSGQADITIEGSIAIEDEGTPLVPNARFLNFEGSGVTATISGIGVDITIPGLLTDWTLIETEVVGAGPPVGGMSLSGLNSETDGMYCIMGRVIVDEIENLRLLLSGVNDYKTVGMQVDSGAVVDRVQFDEWFIAPIDPLANDDTYVIYFTAFVYPTLATQGATATGSGYRFGHSMATVFQDNGVEVADVSGYQCFQVFRNDVNSFTFIDVQAGNFFEGSEVSIYKLTV